VWMGSPWNSTSCSPWEKPVRQPKARPSSGFRQWLNRTKLKPPDQLRQVSSGSLCECLPDPGIEVVMSPQTKVRRPRHCPPGLRSTVNASGTPMKWTQTPDHVQPGWVGGSKCAPSTYLRRSPRRVQASKGQAPFLIMGVLCHGCAKAWRTQ